jgi:hypothetical protein
MKNTCGAVLAISAEIRAQNAPNCAAGISISSEAESKVKRLRFSCRLQNCKVSSGVNRV